MMRFGRSPVHTKKKRVAPTAHWSPEARLLARQIIIGLGIFFMIGGVTAVVWNVTRIPGLTIQTISTEGGVTINPHDVAAVASTTLSGSYLRLVPRQFAWTYPEDEMLAAVATVPRVKNPHIDRVSNTEVAITYEEYLPFALWCDSATSSACYFIDETGYAFAEAPALKGGSFSRYLTTDWPPILYSIMPAGERIRDMERFLVDLEASTTLAAETIEIDAMQDAFLTVAGGGEIKFSLEQDLVLVLDNLRSILASKEFSSIEPGTFQYIDLRFGNKVFVNTDTGLATSTATSTLEAVIEATLASTTALEE